jgi:hypothetical protein
MNNDEWQALSKELEQELSQLKNKYKLKKLILLTERNIVASIGETETMGILLKGIIQCYIRQIEKGIFTIEGLPLMMDEINNEMFSLIKKYVKEN